MLLYSCDQHTQGNKLREEELSLPRLSEGSVVVAQPHLFGWNTMVAKCMKEILHLMVDRQQGERQKGANMRYPPRPTHQFPDLSK